MKRLSAFALNELFFIGQLPFLDLDAVFLGKVFQCLRVGHLFVLHDEVHYIAALATGKAFAQSLGWRYVERRGLIVVERAQTYIVHPRFRSVTKSDTTSTICAASRILSMVGWSIMIRAQSYT